MTADDVTALLRIGRCHAARRLEQPCATCDEIDAAIAHVEAFRDVLRAASDLQAGMVQLGRYPGMVERMEAALRKLEAM